MRRDQGPAVRGGETSPREQVAPCRATLLHLEACATVQSHTYQLATHSSSGSSRTLTVYFKRVSQGRAWSQVTAAIRLQRPYLKALDCRCKLINRAI